MSGRPRSFEPEEALKACMEVFWRKGFDGTGIPDLEAATGLGRQSLYNAFGDKRALFEQVVELYFAQVFKRGLIDVLDAEGSPRANIERVFRTWEAVAESSEFNGCLVGSASAELGGRDLAVAELLERKFRLVEQAFYRTIRRAQQAAEVSSDIDARSTARALVTLSQGLAVVARVNRERGFVRGVMQSMRRLLA